jgi:hypothetical protein
MGGPALAVLVAAELARQGLGADATGIIDNVLRHESPPPLAAPAQVRRLLGDPLRAADARSLFEGVVPDGLHDLTPLREPFDAALERTLGELATAQRLLADATRGLAEVGVGERLPSADALAAIARGADLAGIERANALFLAATMRLARAARGADLGEPRTLGTAAGTVVIGSLGADRHRAAAVLIVDPGGDDLYERPPARSGSFSAIIDLGGDDRYRGGVAAAIAGASLVLDLAGNDRYESERFAQGAAAFGLAALVDDEGDDEYRIGAGGQGFALAGGVGLLWDRGGNDRYFAAGLADPFGRGALSFAQGAAAGTRTIVGGGIGILRDERGDDRYEAQLFAQGSGYYYGAGVLWDEAGDDRYGAVRYAQGAAAHQAVGVLREDSGNDRYALGHGAGQGMGLDLAVGALVDGGGDDRYAARYYAQGTATANGFGLLADAGGADRLRVEDRYAWGVAEPLRGLPSVGVLLGGKDALLEKVDPIPAAEAPAEDQPCPQPDLAVRREHFDALLATGLALHCRLGKGEMWDAAAALLERDPADALAAWIAPALPAAPEGMREKLRQALGRHPSCGVRAAVLTERDMPAAMQSTCWRLQAAALRLGATPSPSLPSFLRGRRAY